MNQGYGNFLNGLETGQIGVGIGSTLPQQQNGSGFQLPPGTNPTDPQAEAAYVQYLSQQPGADPTLATDPNYWIGKINETGGLTQGNIGYWNNRSLAGAGDSGGGGGLNGALGGALSGYSDFAKTGGLSPQDQQALRDQSEAAVRGVYGTAQSNLNQNRELQQFSPNYAAATAKMARDMGYGVSQADIGTNAAIAQMIQQGKLSGLAGMTGVGGINNQAQAANLQAELGALGGNTSLYGTAPGMGATYGNQLLGSGNSLLGSQQTQNQIGGQLIKGQLGESNVPGDFQQGMGNVMSFLGPVSGFLSPFGFGSSGGGGGVPGSNTTAGYGAGSGSTYYGLQ